MSAAKDASESAAELIDAKIKAWLIGGEINSAWSGL
jgi:hypothetical protein